MRAISILLILTLTLSACAVTRPGEIRPARITGCDTVNAETRGVDVETLTDAQIARMTYCRQAEESEAAKATEQHSDFVADMTFLGIVINLAGIVAAVLVANAGTE